MSLSSEALNVHSKFVYGFEIDARNNYLDFKEGLVTFPLRIPRGKYSPFVLAKKIEQEINRVAANVYSVTYNYNTSEFYILKTPASPFVSFSILDATGPNAAYSMAGVIGISGDVNSANVIGYGSHISSTFPVEGLTYSTQFPLQDYNDSESHKRLFDSVINTTYGNRKELVSFGDVSLIDMRLDWITNRLGHDSSFGFLRDNAKGIEDARQFLNWLMYRGSVDFFKDESTSTPSHYLVLDGNSTEYFLKEKVAQGLPSYFSTDKLTMSVLKFLDEDTI